MASRQANAWNDETAIDPDGRIREKAIDQNLPAVSAPGVGKI